MQLTHLVSLLRSCSCGSDAVYIMDHLHYTLSPRAALIDSIYYCWATLLLKISRNNEKKHFTKWNPNIMSHYTNTSTKIAKKYINGSCHECCVIAGQPLTKVNYNNMAKTRNWEVGWTLPVLSRHETLGSCEAEKSVWLLSQCHFFKRKIRVRTVWGR
jgi:hypothetical protein